MSAYPSEGDMPAKFVLHVSEMPMKGEQIDIIQQIAIG